MSVIIAACTQNNKRKTYAKTIQDTFSAPKVTLLSQLPARDKPKVRLLENAPAPLSTTSTPVYNSIGTKDAGETKKSQPVSRQTNAFSNNISKPGVVSAQGKGFFHTYTTDDGLALDQVYCSYKDIWGNLWFGTNGGGVSKYDGKVFSTYTTAQGLANNVIWCITQDHAGNLWFGTDGSGASKFDGERFTNYNTVQGLPDNVIFSIIEDKKNNLWFGTLKGGVSKYDNKTFTNYSTAQGLAGNAVKSIIEDRTGNIWLGTLGGGVSKYDGQYFTNYTTDQGLANNAVWSICEDDSGHVWFGTEGNEVSKFDGNTFTNYNTSGDINDNTILDITKDKRGNLWLGSLKGGVIKYDGNFFSVYSTTHGLANNEVRTVLADEKGNLWFGTLGGGVSKYDGQSFTNFTIEQGLAKNIIWSIAEDSIGNLWFGTSGGGISKYDGHSFTNYTKFHGFANDEVYCAAIDNNSNLWFGTSGSGVFKFDGNNFTNYTIAQGLANNVVFNILPDRKGNLWFGTSGGGVSKYDGKTFTNFTTVQGLANDVVFSIKEDRNGHLWFGTLGGGVSKFDGESFTNYTTSQGLANNVVWAVTEDKAGDLWFGTQQGLSVLRREAAGESARENKSKKNFAGYAFESYTTNDGLPDNFITQVVQGDAEKLYIGTNLGMCELISRHPVEETQKKWVVGKIFNAQNGYPVKDVNAGLHAMFKDHNGVMWIGTGSDKTGLVRFDPRAIIDYTSILPSVVINNVKINNENVCWRDLNPELANERTDSNATAANITEEVNTYGRKLVDWERDSIRARFGTISFESISKWYPVPQNLVLPFFFNNIGFDFNAIETGKNFLVKYQYMLEGYDKQWSPPGYKTSANFGNINEGTYTFMLKAQSPEGVWSKPLTYSFKVFPPWWRTWWMYMVYAILTIAFGALFFWWNNRRILQQKKILEHKVIVATKQLREENKKVEAQKRKTEKTLKELEAAQGQLIQSAKMASLGELAAGIAHEIQNPLNFVTNFSEVNRELIEELKSEKLKAESERDDQLESDILKDIQNNFEKINHHGKRADAIVKGMLQHSQTSTGQKESTNINALANEYLKLTFQGLRAKDKSFNATVQKNFDKELSSEKNINIVPQDIGRVLLNLYNNAFYAVHEKMQTSKDLNSYEPTVLVTTKKIDDKVELTVKDNGNGIPQNIIDKIFQPFFTTKPTGQGTGLGLSLSYDIIKAHAGKIKVETKEGEGTEFIIQLPL